MKPRNIIHNEGGEPFTVHQLIILKNFWEYYLGETDKDGVAFGYVMGIENEWGSVYLPEIEPYIIGRARANDLWHIMPPEGYYWEDEKVINNRTLSPWQTWILCYIICRKRGKFDVEKNP